MQQEESSLTVRQAYPPWPTSKPGPEETPPLPGEVPQRRRPEQMVVVDQEQEYEAVEAIARRTGYV